MIQTACEQSVGVFAGRKGVSEGVAHLGVGNIYMEETI